jgi:hypothetical protein
VRTYIHKNVHTYMHTYIKTYINSFLVAILLHHYPHREQAWLDQTRPLILSQKNHASIQLTLQLGLHLHPF